MIKRVTKNEKVLLETIDNLQTQVESLRIVLAQRDKHIDYLRKQMNRALQAEAVLKG